MSYFHSNFFRAQYYAAKFFGAIGGGAGSVVQFFSGISRVGGVVQHRGISRPTIQLADAGGGTYLVTKTHEVYAETPGSISDTTYLIDGELP